MSELSIHACTISRAETESDLVAIKAIHRANKQTLGLFPEGAFVERLNARQIAIASLQGVVVGYVLFTVNLSSEVRITHLAIESSHRGKRISSQLLDYLKTEFADCVRIRLNCRADFDASRIWPRLGFTMAKRIAGKSKLGSELIVFHYRLTDMPLFAAAETKSTAISVVCDANVCIDIRYPNRPRHENASGLMVDWLAEEIVLGVTEEVFNDLDRQNDPLRSEMISEIRTNWNIVAPDSQVVERFREIFRELLGPPAGDDDVSDQSHLAIAAAYNASSFATYDEGLLRKASEIFCRTGLRIQKPSEIITGIDKVLRASHYEFRDLKNSGIERLRVASVNEIELERFVEFSQGETHKSFASFIDGVLSLPQQWELYQYRDSSGRAAAITLVKKEGDNCVGIQRLRVARKLGHRIANSLNEHLAQHPLGTHPPKTLSIFRLDDPQVSANLVAACRRRGFNLANDRLWRVSLPGLWGHQQLLEKLAWLVSNSDLPKSVADKLVSLANDAEEPDNPQAAQSLERLIFPGKLLFGGLPTYVIPIRPEWAQELFDFRLWNLPMFEPDTRLLLNPDSVYYKLPKNSPKTDIGRILWYVSGDSKKGGKAIRACSSLTKGVKGTVKDLFTEFERLGVFEWHHLMDHFKEPNVPAFAIEFTNTELLANPVSLDSVNDFLLHAGMKKRQIFASTVRIPDSGFQMIYQQATQEN